MHINFKNFNLSKFSSLSFKLSIFLLPSAFAISAFLILICLVIRIFESGLKEIIKDKWNLSLMASLFLMVISCIFNNSLSEDLIIYDIPIDYFKNWSPSFSWIGLLNWWPMFLIFIYFQKYLSTYEDRKIVGKLFILGTIPVLVSGFLQIWFGIYGPFQIFNGLVIWYQREWGDYPIFTAMFNNQNYTGSWLNIVWPFVMAILLDTKKQIFKRNLIFILSVFTTIAVYATFSRNAYLGYLISTGLILNGKYSLIYGIIVTFLSIPILLARFNINPVIQEFFQSFIHSKFWNASNFLNFSNFLNQIRFNIWEISAKYILKRPFIGWGASSFPILFELETLGTSQGNQLHPHNIFLSLALNYGIIVSLIILSFIIAILLKAFKKYTSIFKNELKPKVNLSFDKAWLISCFVLIISQLFDIQYYDGRISISLWILIAGLKNF